eukprot:CAMPEP_0197659450 /NCGR_PEP_ID=MMETSP1338-20131121/47697_1 /TAXON_ID=43686 ORGANISM="Pelagodinium beii, Strain RCC1491" /NCGR_SAMPLE_ID=MMETSP1338 /ASSEMBLY_ACC=CAM_ASM_000754 /LENGTH=183 /DNA_ID=CAMNT_0043236379 /DNA_START=14 /DNA_END=566 /DNA_ORIENTATION=+
MNSAIHSSIAPVMPAIAIPLRMLFDDAVDHFFLTGHTGFESLRTHCLGIAGSTGPLAARCPRQAWCLGHAVPSLYAGSFLHHLAPRQRALTAASAHSSEAAALTAVPAMAFHCLCSSVQACQFGPGAPAGQMPWSGFFPQDFCCGSLRDPDLALTTEPCGKYPTEACSGLTLLSGPSRSAAPR